MATVSAFAGIRDKQKMPASSSRDYQKFSTIAAARGSVRLPLPLKGKIA
jgi:hypothetical protein